MAESIQNRKALQTQIRSNQQELARKKQELAAQQKEDLQSMKSFYADKNRELDNSSAATVNHIKLEAQANTENDRPEETPAAPQSAAAKKTTYNRKAQTEPLIQNYETKETDKFYKVQDRGSRLKENGTAYIIEAYAPEHEQNNLRVSIQNNKATISGQRKHSESAELENKKMTTNNFQTFREEFKFDRPVSHQGMTRERIGDFVRFSIPKLEAVGEPDDA